MAERATVPPISPEPPPTQQLLTFPAPRWSEGEREKIEAAWLERGASAIGRTGVVDLLVVRVGGGAHETPPKITLCPEEGVRGDRWAESKRDPDAQVSFIDRRVAELLVVDRASMHLPGDNLVVDLDLDVESLPVGARLELGSALIEITAKPHAGCTKFKERLGGEVLAWINAPEHKFRRLRGVYAKIVRAGEVAVGDCLRRAVETPSVLAQAEQTIDFAD